MKFKLQSKSTSNAGLLASRLGHLVNTSIVVSNGNDDKSHTTQPLAPFELQFPQPPLEQPNGYDPPAVPTYFPQMSTDVQPPPKRVCIDASNEQVWPTPNYLQYTYQAAIPHISWTIAHRLLHPNAPVLMPLGHCLTMQNTLAKYGKGIKQFARIPNQNLLLMSSFDPLRLNASDSLHKSNISIWCQNGRKQIDPRDYQQSTEAFRPEAVTSLIDTALPDSLSTKQTVKYIEKSQSFLERHIEQREIIQSLSENQNESKSFEIFASIPNLSETQLSSTLKNFEKINNQLFGFCFFVTSSDQTNDFERIDRIVKQLPADKIRMVLGSLTPTQIIQLARIGVDLFDNSFCTQCTEQHQALIIKSDASLCDFEWESLQLEQKERFERDYSVLDSKCDCYACQHQFTRSYICHLATSHEMLAKVLLQLHNIHSYDRLFKLIRS